MKAEEELGHQDGKDVRREWDKREEGRAKGRKE